MYRYGCACSNWTAEEARQMDYFCSVCGCGLDEIDESNVIDEIIVPV